MKLSKNNRKVIGKKYNGRVILTKRSSGYILTLKTLDNNYKGIDGYIHHEIIRNKLVVNALPISDDGAELMLRVFANTLGYEISKKDDIIDTAPSFECPVCGAEDVIWTCYCNKCKEAH